MFSAAYKENSRISRLWAIENISLITSIYAMEEAKRNLLRLQPERMSSLQSIAETMKVIAAEQPVELEDNFGLPEKDIPILQAAVHADVDYLLTGDLSHFGHLLGKQVQNVLILTPAQFLALHFPKSR